MPHDPFTKEEAREVELLVQGLPPMLGVRSFERILRARESIARLKANVKSSPMLLPELFAEGALLAKKSRSGSIGRSRQHQICLNANANE